MDARGWSGARSGGFRIAALAVTVGATVSAGAGCNWTKFQDEADRAPVRSIGAPSGFDSADFGKSITPLSSGQGSAAAFVATSVSSNETHMVLLKVDRSGGIKSYAVSGTALADLASSAITAVAEVPAVPAEPGSSLAATKLLLGTPVVKNEDFGRMYTLELPDAAGRAANPASPVGNGTAATFAFPSLGSLSSGLGRGLAAGFLGGGPAADYVVGSDNELAVAVDGLATLMSPTASLPLGACDVGYDNLQENRYRVRRPLLIAPLWNDPAVPGAQQLIVGLTHTGVMPGKLAFMNLTAAGALNCLTTEVGAKAQFGHAVATGDFDGDQQIDLLVGAPGQQAFVYRNWSSQPLGVVPPSPLAMTSPGALDFGYAVAALNVDGEPGDEAVVSDPQAQVGDKANAGKVQIFKYNPMTATMDLWKELHDLTPESDAQFGYTVNVLPFCTADVSGGGACPASATARILLVGGSNEVFLFYRLGENVPVHEGQTVADVRAP